MDDGSVKEKSSVFGHEQNEYKVVRGRRATTSLPSRFIADDESHTRGGEVRLQK